MIDEIVSISLSDTVTAETTASNAESLIDRWNKAISMATLAIDMERLWRGHREWSDATFGPASERGPVGALKHLSKEALEAADDPSDVTEFVDCLFLFWDALHRAGFTMADVVAAGFPKLEVLHTRHYPKTPEGEPAEHDRSGEA